MSSKPRINPRYLFPALGWRCIECSLHPDYKTVDGVVGFEEIPIVGWGVVEVEVEGDGERREYSEMQLLLAVQDTSRERPSVFAPFELESWHSNCLLVYLPPGEALDEENKSFFADQLRRKLARQKEES